MVTETFVALLRYERAGWGETVPLTVFPTVGLETSTDGIEAASVTAAAGVEVTASPEVEASTGVVRAPSGCAAALLDWVVAATGGVPLFAFTDAGGETSGV